MKFLYPEGKKKALTFSYDDGQVYDRQLIEIWNRYGLRGTVHLNSGNIGMHGEHEEFVTVQELSNLYIGHEIACHGVYHKNLAILTKQQIVAEIGKDRCALEELTGRMVQGFSYAFGNYSAEIKKIASLLGIKYARTANSTGGFFPPVDFMEWHPTCHHNDRLLERGDEFLEAPDYIELPLMYVWGHSFEFGRQNNWELMESFARKMSGKEDIWYATNIEIYNYLQAIRVLEYSADGSRVYNPTLISIWLCMEGKVIIIEPGKTITLK